MPRTVLIADADSQWRDVCRRCLAKCGFTVRTAADGRDCLSQVQARLPDVLVLDLSVLWSGGDGLLASLRQAADGPVRPLVIVTGSMAPEHMSEGTEIPCCRCLEKPFHVNTLLNLIGCAAAPEAR